MSTMSSRPSTSSIDSGVPDDGLSGSYGGDELTREMKTDVCCPQCGQKQDHPLCSKPGAVGMKEINDKLEKVCEEVKSLKADVEQKFNQLSERACTPEYQKKCQSTSRTRFYTESELYKRKKPPKICGTRKSLSADDATEVTTQEGVMESYTKLQHGHYPKIPEEDEEYEDIGIDELLRQCPDEDLTDVELSDISDMVDPEILRQLAVYLHKNTQSYSDIMERLYHLPTSDKAFKILKQWHNNTNPGPQCRKQLVKTFHRLQRIRIAHAIAIKPTKPT